MVKFNKIMMNKLEISIKEIENSKRNQKEILGLKSIITEIKKKFIREIQRQI